MTGVSNIHFLGYSFNPNLGILTTDLLSFCFYAIFVGQLP